MEYTVRQVTIDDYDAMYELWNSTEQSRRALNPVDDSRDGIGRYLKRNPNTCFAAVKDDKIIGVILTGHDGRRAIIHHMCVHPDYRRMGIAGHLVALAEEALKKEGIDEKRFKEIRNALYGALVMETDHAYTMVNRMVGNHLNGAVTLDSVKALQMITAEDLVKRAVEIFDRERSCLSVINPAKEEE